MATITHGVTTVTSAAADTYATAAFTPAADDVLVAFAVVTATNTTPGTMTDDDSGTWSSIRTVDRAATMTYAFVRDTFASGAEIIVTLDVTGDTGSGCALCVARVAGLSREGLLAVRSSGADQGAGTTTPGLTFTGGVCLAANTLLGCVSNGTNPAGLSEPTTPAMTEYADTGFAVPDTGLEYAGLNSGYSNTGLFWASVSATAWSAILVELDTSPESTPGLLLKGVG